MSNSEQPTASSNNWSTKGALILAVVALAIGLPIGYVVRGSSSVIGAQAVPAPDAMQPSVHTAPAMPDEKQMKHMAEKQAEPLMAELQKNPNDPALLAKVGKTYLFARQFQTAADYYEKSARIKPDADVLTTLGGVYHYAGDGRKALDAWDRALKLDPGHADALVNIGLLKWREQGDAKSAIAAWQQMLKTNPNHPKRADVEKMIAQAQKHESMAAASPR